MYEAIASRVLASEPTNRERVVFACQVLASEPANRVLYGTSRSGAS